MKHTELSRWVRFLFTILRQGALYLDIRQIPCYNEKNQMDSSRNEEQ